jgi:hypothetical protein
VLTNSSSWSLCLESAPTDSSATSDHDKHQATRAYTLCSFPNDAEKYVRLAEVALEGVESADQVRWWHRLVRKPRARRGMSPQPLEGCPKTEAANRTEVVFRPIRMPSSADSQYARPRWASRGPVYRSIDDLQRFLSASSSFS